METAAALPAATNVRPLPQPWRRILLFVLDFTGLAVALFAAVALLRMLDWGLRFTPGGIWTLLLLFAGWLLLYYLNRHYDTRVSHRRRADIASFVKTTVLAAMLGGSLLALFGKAQSHLWPVPLVVGFLFVFLGLLLRHLGWRLLASSRLKMPLFVVAAEAVFRRVAEMVVSQPWGPFLQPRAVGSESLGHGVRDIPREEALHERSAPGPYAVVTADCRLAGEQQQQLDRRSGSRTIVWGLPDFAEQAARLVPVEALSEEWAQGRLASPSAAASVAKRILDLLLGAVFFLIGLPLGLVISLLIVLEAPGSVFYLQPRTGYRNRRFSVFKFRTMDEPRELSDSKWAAVNDPRVTRFGRLLRLYRLNELPQLLNVLTGNMSLVGPRPELPDFARMLAQEIPCYNRRHLVKPGMTGWAQVNFRYGATVDEARIKLEYDLYYVKHCSVWLDIYILLRTIVIILGGKGR